jgi:hypothetical protein
MIQAGVPAERVAAEDREAHSTANELLEPQSLAQVVVLGMSRDDHESRPRPHSVPAGDICICEVGDRIPAAFEPVDQRQVVAEHITGAIALDVGAQRGHDVGDVLSPPAGLASLAQVAVEAQPAPGVVGLPGVRREHDGDRAGVRVAHDERGVARARAAIEIEAYEIEAARPLRARAKGS